VNKIFSAIQKILPLAASMAGVQFINIASSFLCMVMLAKLGYEVLAASALIYAIQISIMVFGMSIFFSLSFLIGHAYGAGNHSTIGNYLQQGWTLALLVSIPIMIIFAHIGHILIFFGQSPEIVQIVQNYFNAYIWTTVPVLLVVCNQQFCFGIQKQKLVILASSLSVIILVSSAYALIFGKFGMPALGVAGLGYANALQAIFSLTFITLFFYFDKSFKIFSLFNYRVHKGLSHLKQMFKMGWPISVQMGGELMSFLANSIMVGWLGATALAAMQVANQYMFLAVIPFFALSQASGILIGQANGGKQFQEIKNIGHASICVTLAVGILVAIVFLLAPRAMASLYLNINDPINAETVHLIVLLFMIMAASQIFDSLRNVLTGSLRGLFDTRYPMYISLVAIWIIGIPLSYFLGFILKWGIIGIAVGGSCAMLLAALAMLQRWSAMTRKYNEISI